MTDPSSEAVAAIRERLYARIAEVVTRAEAWFKANPNVPLTHYQWRVLKSAVTQLRYLESSNPKTQRQKARSRHIPQRLGYFEKAREQAQAAASPPTSSGAPSAREHVEQVEHVESNETGSPRRIE